jgi:hypothetical protein
MKVKIEKPFVLHDGRSFAVGSIQDLAPADAKPLVKAHFASPVYERTAEQAVKVPTETR